MQAALSATPAVLTVELDPAAIVGDRPPEPLDRDRAALLAGPIADDLRRIIGENVAEAGMVMPAALYDLTELLRPGLPMVEALLDVYRGSLRGGAFEPQLLALGSAGGRFPESAIAPARQRGSGPLLAIPFALVAPGPALDPLRQILERDLLEKGRAGLATDRAIRQLLGVEPVHLSYATFHDLAALFKVQLEHADFAGLWQLLEGALYRPEQIECVTLPRGNRFLGLGGQVWTPWLTWDTWARQHNSDAGDTEAGYAEWMQTQRQYMAGLSRHGVEVRVTAPRDGIAAADAEVALSVAEAHALSADAGHYRETLAAAGDTLVPAAAAVVSVTEQASPLLGPIAYTVMVQAADGSLLTLVHDYPLEQQAIAPLLAHWEAEANAVGATWHLERPGTITAAGRPAHLQPWLDFDGTA